MNNKLQFRRALLLLGFLGAAFAGLGYRLVDLQIHQAITQPRECQADKNQQ